MGIMISPDSEYAHERVKWETEYTSFGPPGRAKNFTEFPQYLYKATRSATGGAPIIEYFLVHDEQERRNMQSRGFVIGPDNAIKALEASELSVATAAAERAYTDRKLSPKAQQEAQAVDVTTISHLGDVTPEMVKEEKQRRPGRPRKVYSIK